MNVKVKHNTVSKQRGVALLTSLVFLLILTIIGTFGMKISHMENMMSGNNQYQTTALNNAERSLKFALDDLTDTLATGKDFNITGDYFFDSTAVGAAIETVDPHQVDWSSITSTATPGDSNSNYIIEYQGCHAKFGNSNICNDPLNTCFDTDACGFVFTITSQSDADKGARRTVQTSFALMIGPAGP